MNSHRPTHTPQPSPRRLHRAALGLFALAAAQLAFAEDQNAPVPPATPPATTAPAIATPATGPSATPASDQTVVLEPFIVQSGFASSLVAAEGAKQDSEAISEVLVPEDLGKLPYVSIADALASLTGLASQRTNGRDQMISIRGLGPDYQVGTLDGVEQATTNDNRGVEYDQYPADLIAGATVYKTGQADMVGGIGGTIDLQTVSPLSIDHWVADFNISYDWTKFPALTPGVNAKGESYNASFIDQWDNGKEGIYMGYSHTENPFHGKEFQAWGYPTADSAGDTILGGMEDWATAELLTRDAGIVVLESKPSDEVYSKLDLMYSSFKDDEDLRGMQVPMAEWSSAQLQPGYTVTGGAVTSYTLKNIQPVLESLTSLRKDHLASGIWNLDVGKKSDWPVHVVAGFSTVRRTDEDLESYAGLGFNGHATDPDTMQITQTSGSIPVVVSSTDYSNASLFTLTDPQGWGTGVFPTTGQEGYLKFFNERDIVDSLKISSTHELDVSILKDLEVGVSFSQRYKQQAQLPTGYLVNADGKPQDALPPLLGVTNLGFMGNLYPIAWDGAALATNGQYTFLQNPNPGTFLGDAFKVWEDVTRPYFQVNLKGDIGGLPFDGNIGAVVDYADQSSDGYLGNGGSIAAPTSGAASYADFLPSLNLILRPTKHTDIRFSAGRQEARPPMYEMRAGADYGYNGTLVNSTTQSPWSGNTGNPNLRPWISDSVDLSLEHYFPKGGGYVSLAAFDKRLLSYIYQRSTVTNFQGYPYTTSQPPQIYTGFTSQYQNGQGGNVEGLEATGQFTSELLSSGVVKGFGITLNGALTDSNIQPWGPGNGTAPLNNLSKRVANITLYYEYKGFSARVSENYRSATREYITTYGIPNPAAVGTPGDNYSEEQPEKTIDAHVGYTFNNGPMKGVTIYIEGTNLNNEPLITYNNGNPNEITNWQTYGASYKAGVSYKF